MRSGKVFPVAAERGWRVAVRSGWQGEGEGGGAHCREQNRKEGKPQETCRPLCLLVCPVPRNEASNNNSKHLLWPYYVPGIVINF